MTGVSLDDMSTVARELRNALDEHDKVCADLPAVEAAYKKAWLQAHAASTTFHPDRKVREHEVAADEASFDLWSALNAETYHLKALKERMHSLRQVLSAYQTQARVESSLDGPPFEQARRAS